MVFPILALATGAVLGGLFGSSNANSNNQEKHHLIEQNLHQLQQENQFLKELLLRGAMGGMGMPFGGGGPQMFGGPPLLPGGPMICGCFF